MNQYRDFAFVYDKLMDDVDYEGWINYIEQIIKNETGIKKMKGIVKITGNQFLWKDIVEKMTLLIREHM